MGKVHLLKIKEVYFREVNCERKKSELRINDRDFQIGDYIVFTDLDGCIYSSPSDRKFTLLSQFRPKVDYLDFYEITNVLPVSECIKSRSVKDWVILSIRKIKE